MITEEQLDEWRALVNRATPGAWYVGEHTGELFSEAHGLLGDNDLCTKDVEFISAARTAFPALLDEVERLRELCYMFGRDIEHQCKACKGTGKATP